MFFASSMSTFIFLFLTHFHKIIKEKAQRECPNNYTVFFQTKVAVWPKVCSWLADCIVIQNSQFSPTVKKSTFIVHETIWD